MKKINRTAIFSVLVVLAYLLSACSGAPVAQKVDSSNSSQSQTENSGVDNINTNSNDSNVNDNNANDGNLNDNTSNSNDNQDDNSNSNNGNDNGNSNANADNAQEVSGVVEAITADSITINGVTYTLADFTEFKSQIAVGDQVKVHVIVIFSSSAGSGSGRLIS